MTKEEHGFCVAITLQILEELQWLLLNESEMKYEDTVQFISQEWQQGTSVLEK
jgi:hypothetical protein